MEKIQKDYGCLIMGNGHIYDIEGDYTGEGWVFKDMEAFHTGEGICYVSEYGLNAIEEELTDLEARYENGTMSDEEYRFERERIIIDGAETRQTIIDQVWEAFGEDYMFTQEQLLYFAEDVLQLAEWAYICTYLAENFEIEDCIEFGHIKGDGMFNQLQYDAVMSGMTPKEYAESKGLKPLNAK